MPKSSPKPSVEEICENADPESEVEHLVICPVCGQIFDCRDAAHVAHHAAPEHAPLLSPPRRHRH